MNKQKGRIISSISNNFNKMAGFLVVAAFNASAVDYYISPTGSDTSGDGSISAPWQTLHKARDTARALSRPLTENVNIILRDGTYELASTLSLTSADSGNSSFKVIYKAENPGQAVISGGSVVTGWTDTNNDGIWEATVPAGSDSRQLYVNGIRATRARSANGNGWSRNGTGYTAPSDVAAWNNQDDIELVFNFRWKHNRLRVASVAGTQATLTPESWAGVQMGPFGIADQEAQGSTVKWVENNLALLDDPGEWYLDTSLNRLYYKPRGDEDLINGNAAPNLALSGTATQSSTFSGSSAQRAIDGNTSGNWGAGEVTHTNVGSQPYWTLDLGSAQTIDKIRLWNRTDCCSDRLNDFHVFVSDTPFTGSTVADSQNQAGVFDHHNPGTAATTVDVNVNRTGRYVRVQRSSTASDTVLSLAEIQVFGEATGGSGTGTPVILPRLQTLVDGNGATNVRFEGLTFSHTTWLQPNEPVGYLSVQAGVWQEDSASANVEAAFEHTKATPGALHFTFAKDVVFSGNTFKNLGASGVHFDRGSQLSTIFNNTFERTSSGAIVISNPQDHHLLDPSHLVKDILVDNNLLRNIAEEYTDSPAITSFWTDRAVIINNTINNVAYSGVSIGWGWGRYDVEPWDILNTNSLKGYNHPTTLKDNLVLNNFVTRAMAVNHDGGCVYNLGANMNSRVTGNVCTASPDLNGAVYLDNGSRGFEVSENVTYNNVGPRVNFHIKGTEFHTVTNNDLSGGNANFNPAFQNVVDAAGQKSTISERSVADIVSALPPSLGLPAGAVPAPFGAVVGKIATASTNANQANNAIDANAGTFWDAGSATTGWLQVDMDGLITLQEVVVAFGKINNGEIDYIRNGVTFQIQTSNDGSNWVNQTFSTADGFGGSKVDPTTSVTTVQGIYQVFVSGTPAVRYVRVNVSNSTEPLGILRMKLKGPVAPSGTNLALNGTATQSSTWNGNIASRAIDGNTGGNWSANEITHTDVGSQNYWDLDLGSVKSINEIVLWNRTDCCASRLTNFYVFVSDVPFTGPTLANSQATAGVFEYQNAGIASTSTNVAVNRTGRYVRVQLANTSTTDGNNLLSLAEVQVFGSDVVSNTNLALVGTASQSSTILGGVASRANDGNTGGSYPDGQTTHTDLGSQNYWQLDLGSVRTIESVRIWNRTDCCTTRLTNFHLLVSDTPFNGNTLADAQATTSVFDHHNAGTAATTTDISVNRTGRYVRVQLANTANNGENVLSLAEVEVLGQ